MLSLKISLFQFVLKTQNCEGFECWFDANLSRRSESVVLTGYERVFISQLTQTICLSSYFYINERT